MRNARVAAAHRPAAWSLFVTFALLSGGAPGADSAESGESSMRCPATAREAAQPRRVDLKLAGYKLLRAGRVDDAIAFFQLNVGGHRRVEGSHPTR